MANSLLLCEPSAINRRVNDFFSQFHDQADGIETGRTADSWSFDLSIDEYEEYQHKDFNEIVERIIELDALATAHWTKIAGFSIQTERERRARRRQR